MKPKLFFAISFTRQVSAFNFLFVAHSPTRLVGNRGLPLRMISTEEKKCEDHGVKNIAMNPTGKENLWKFATHTSEDYHYFSPEEAAAIRSALLKWFRQNRRRLPWRGDEGPYNGSTAGIGTQNVKTSTKKKDANQTDIASFFGKKSPKKGEKKTIKKGGKDEITEDDAHHSKEEEKSGRIPVTGYSVWVSEIMLQQTRVEAVIKYYLKWMERFPTVQHLADATEEDVNAHWAGLGFYRRARFLHAGAKYVVDNLDGVVPDTVDDLLQISGIGRYTASAIASIAFEKSVPVVDGNVCRVLSRLKGVANNIKAPIFKDKIGWQLAEQIVSAGDGKHAGEVNQAMMELGATYCSPAGTGIHEDDPLVEFYLSTKIGLEANELIKNGDLLISDFVSTASLARGAFSCPLCENDGISSTLFQLAADLVEAQTDPMKSQNAATIGHSKFPTPPPRKTKREEILSVAALSHLDDGGIERWFMIKRPADGLLAGQWEFPSSIVWSSTNGGKKSASKKAVKIPTIDKDTMKQAIDDVLTTCSIDTERCITVQDTWNDSNTKIVRLDDSPIEHIFSHVRWNIFCSYGDVSKSQFSSVMIENDYVVEHKSSSCRWMSETDMHDVGITSSVKKIMASVKLSRIQQSNKKRKRSR